MLDFEVVGIRYCWTSALLDFWIMGGSRIDGSLRIWKQTIDPGRLCCLVMLIIQKSNNSVKPRGQSSRRTTELLLALVSFQVSTFETCDCQIIALVVDESRSE